jgi:hypothetical protein
MLTIEELFILVNLVEKNLMNYENRLNSITDDQHYIIKNLYKKLQLMVQTQTAG